VASNSLASGGDVFRGMGWPALCFASVVVGGVLVGVFLLSSQVAGLPKITITAEGIGGIATAAGLLYTWHDNRRRRREQEAERLDKAAALAIAFNHELTMIIGTAGNLGKILKQVPKDQTAVKLDACMRFIYGIHIPLLGENVERLDRFNGADAAALMKVITGVFQSQRKDRPSDKEIAQWNGAQLRSTTKHLVGTARLLRRDADIALERLQPYFSRFARRANVGDGARRRTARPSRSSSKQGRAVDHRGELQPDTGRTR
jgi:hypothetical protein